MAIETICRGCARKLRVGDEFAGRKARCPHCKTIYTVPAATGLDTSSPSAAGTSDMWLLRTKDGTVYGPVAKSELDSWVSEGRLDAASQVRKESEASWQQATEIYPQLVPRPAARDTPFSSEPTFTTQATNPYAAPPDAEPLAAGPAVGPLRPHRGGMILTFGVLGFACCQVFAIVAWVMGHTDLKEIDAGRMDPAGRGLTLAGMIIGIIGTLLLVFTVGVQILFVLFAFVNN